MINETNQQRFNKLNEFYKSNKVYQDDDSLAYQRPSLLNFNLIEQNNGVATQIFIQPYSSDEDTEKLFFSHSVPSVSTVVKELTDYNIIKHITVYNLINSYQKEEKEIYKGTNPGLTILNQNNWINREQIFDFLCKIPNFEYV